MTDDELASLGLSMGANGVESPSVHEKHLVHDGAVVGVHAESDASSPPAPNATDGERDALGADDIAALLAGAPDELASAPASSTDGDASSPADATPRGPASMLQTQRGVGPFPPPSNLADDATGTAPEEPSLPDGDVAPPDADRLVAEDGGTTRSLEPPAVGVSLEASPSAAEGAAPPPVLAGAPTGGGPARFVDHDISHAEALDELGVRGLRRVIRVVVAALALGGVATFTVLRLRSTHPDSSASAPVATGSPSPLAVAAEPPRPSPVAEAPPSVPLPSPTPLPTPSPTASGVAADVPEPPLPSREESSKAAKAPAPAIPQEPSGAASPGSDIFRRQLAECRGLFGRNRFRDAGVACAAAVEANPRSSEALTMLAHVELNRGHLGRANELAQKAISIYPDQPDAYVIIGGVHQEGGRNTQAKAAYLQYLHLAPHGRYAAELQSIVGRL